jgi:hypothetical protein
MHTQAVLLQFAMREVGPALVKALADWDELVWIQGQQGLVLGWRCRMYVRLFST